MDFHFCSRSTKSFWRFFFRAVSFSIRGEAKRDHKNHSKNERTGWWECIVSSPSRNSSTITCRQLCLHSLTFNTLTWNLLERSCDFRNVPRRELLSDFKRIDANARGARVCNQFIHETRRRREESSPRRKIDTELFAIRREKTQQVFPALLVAVWAVCGSSLSGSFRFMQMFLWLEFSHTCLSPCQTKRATFPILKQPLGS